MDVPFVDLNFADAELEHQIQQEISQVLASRQYVLGPKVEKFEAAASAYLNVDNAIGLSSGTDALLVALMALDIGEGDIVITPAFSFFATAGVVARVGAQVAFVDIEAESFNVSADLLEQWFKENTELHPRVKAVVVVHLYGRCAEIEAICNVAAKFGVAVIEDAAQAFGSDCRKAAEIKKAGTVGLIGCFSFYPTKNLGALGDAGMLVTNNAAIADKVLLLRNHGAEKRYYHDFVGGNFRMDAFQGAALTVKLPKLNVWNEQRRQIASRYNTLLASLVSDNLIKTPLPLNLATAHCYHQYTIRVSRYRDELKEFLAGKGVGTDVFYPVPFHLQKCFSSLGYELGDFPQSELAAQSVLSLPMYPHLSEDSQDYVVSVIEEFFKN